MSTEKKQQHTPGPWQWRKCDHDEIKGDMWAVEAKLKDGWAYLANVYSAGDDRPESQANARLIAAAPELLEACELVQKAIRSAGLLDVKKRFDLCVADAALGKAIAKATNH